MPAEFSSGGGSKFEFPGAGEYLAYCNDVQECERAVFKDGVKTDQTTPGYRFKFFIYEEGAEDPLGEMSVFTGNRFMHPQNIKSPQFIPTLMRLCRAFKVPIPLNAKDAADWSEEFFLERWARVTARDDEDTGTYTAVWKQFEGQDPLPGFEDFALVQGKNKPGGTAPQKPTAGKPTPQKGGKPAPPKPVPGQESDPFIGE